MIRIDDASALVRAKENCERNGLQWEVTTMSSVKPGFGSKNAGVLDDEGRKTYLIQAQHQLLEEAATKAGAMTLAEQRADLERQLHDLEAGEAIMISGQWPATQQDRTTQVDGVKAAIAQIDLAIEAKKRPG